MALRVTFVLNFWLKFLNTAFSYAFIINNITIKNRMKAWTQIWEGSNLARGVSEICNDESLAMVIRTGNKAKRFSSVNHYAKAIRRYHCLYRSNLTQVFYRIAVQKILSKFNGKHLCWSLYSVKLLVESFLKRDSNTSVFL